MIKKQEGDSREVDEVGVRGVRVPGFPFCRRLLKVKNQAVIFYWKLFRISDKMQL